MAGGEELTDSLASLQAAVARLEDLSSSGPKHVESHVTGSDEGLAGVEAALAEGRGRSSRSCGRPLRRRWSSRATWRSGSGSSTRGCGSATTTRAPSSHRQSRRSAPACDSLAPPPAPDLGAVEAKLDELAALVTRPAPDAPVVELPAVDLSPLSARLDELVDLATRPVEPESGVVGERLGRVEELLTHRADTLSPELAHRLDEIEAAAKRPHDGGLVERFERLEELLDRQQPGVDTSDLRDRLDALQPVSEAAVERLEALGAAMEELRARPESSVSSEQVAELVGSVLEERLGSRDLTWEAAVERLGRLEAALGEALSSSGDARLDALLAAVEELRSRPEPTAAMPSELASRLDALRAAIEQGAQPQSDDRPDVAGIVGAALEAQSARLEERLGSRDLTWEAAVERLGRIEDSLREALVARGDEALNELHARLETLSTQLEDRLGGRDLAWEAAVERLGRLEESLRGALAPHDDGRHDELVARLEDVRAAVTTPQDGEVRERLAALEAAVRARAGLDDHTAELIHSALAESTGRLDERVSGRDLAWEAVAERIGRVEDSLHTALERPQDEELARRLHGIEESLKQAIDANAGGLSTRLEEHFAQLGEHLSSKPDRSGELVGLVRRLERTTTEANEALLERLTATLGALPTQEVLQASLAELRRAVEEPRDGVLHERLDRIDAALAEPDPSQRTLAELQGRLDSLAGELAAASAEALEPVRASLGELQTIATEPPGARFMERLVARSHNQIAERIGELEQSLHGAVPEADSAAVAERDARIADLVEQLQAREPAAPHELAPRRPGPGDIASFLALVPATDGYRLVALEGTLPAPGEGLDLPEDDRRLVVVRLGRSPYPGDARPCAYLQAG